MATFAERAEMLDSDIDSDVRSHLENRLARGVERLLGEDVNGLDVVDVVVFRLLSLLAPEDVVKLAEEAGAIEALHAAGEELRESLRRPRNVVPFRRKEARC